MIHTEHKGRQLVLDALSGRASGQIPVGPITWGFEYYWKLAGLEPWQLAFGGHETWHKAHLAIYERHKPDIVFYDWNGAGEQDPTLVDETSETWVVRDNNSGEDFEMLKSSLTPRRLAAKKERPRINSFEDADELVPPDAGWSRSYLQGLTRLIDDLGDRALVVPHHSPGYIMACYTFGFERSMELLATNPELLMYVADRYAAGDSIRMRQLKAAGCEAVYVADAWASCDIISPKTFESFALPYQRHIAEAAQAEGIKIVLWNEGDVGPVLHLEAELPIDAFAIESPRKGFDLSIAKVREVFGPNRCLFGNLDSEDLLRTGGRGRIAEAVREQLRMSGPGTPFVLSTGSPIPSDVEPEAVDAMIEAARQTVLEPEGLW